MIRFEHVSKAYLGGRQALQGVTFHMQPGEMAFLTGHSGAGKSTLLKLICGIERPSAGKIWFSGHDITRLKNREVPFLRRQIGMIFQDRSNTYRKLRQSRCLLWLNTGRMKSINCKRILIRWKAKPCCLMRRCR